MKRPMVRVWLYSICALLAPVAVLSLYLVISHRTMRQSTATILLGLALVTSVLIGLVFIAALPIPRWTRWLIGVSYVLIMGPGLSFYTLFFACAVFGDCV